MKLVNNLDFSKLQSLNRVAQLLASAPGSPVAGLEYYNSTSNTWQYYNGTAFIDPLARANHTGTQLAATISDFNTAVRTNSLDQMTIPAANVSFNSKNITNLLDPVSPQDGATKNYVDVGLAAAANVAVVKGAVRGASSTNITIASPGTTIDGLTAASGQIFLLYGQTTGSQNGPYVWNGAATPMTRALNWDVQAESVLGSYWIVEEGTKADTFALLSNDGTFTLGTTTATFVFTSAATVYVGSNGVNIAGTAVTGVVVAAGGLTVGASGFALDTAIAVRKFAATIGDGATTAIVVTHNLNTQDITVSVRDASTNAVVLADWTATSVNTATINFAVAPASNAYRVVVHG